MRRMYKIIKRLFDIISSVALFVVISPFFFLMMIIVRIKIGKPIFFHQIRSGRRQKPFNLIKFRTMTNETDSNGVLLPDDKRRTKFGSWLRSSSLDELPELLNIIKGDMSVIGPRPLPPSYDLYYTEREKKRFEVRGGLISPESVDANPFISWDEQLEYDAKYVESLSIKSDVKIFFTVFLMLFKRYETNLGSWTRKPLNVERDKTGKI